MTYYKVLDRNGNSQHGGSFSWSLPSGSGEAAVPGDWHEVPALEVEMCRSGFHLTVDPTKWWKSGSRCFVAEAVDITEENGRDKVVCRRVRLCRELSAAELAKLNVFIEGTHEVQGQVNAVADGTAVVTAYDSSSVKAYDSSSVKAYGNSSVKAYDSSSVKAYGSSSVKAYDNSSVTASGSSTTVKWNPLVKVTLNDRAALVDRSGPVHTAKIGA